MKNIAPRRIASGVFLVVFCATVRSWAAPVSQSAPKAVPDLSAPMIAAPVTTMPAVLATPAIEPAAALEMAQPVAAAMAAVDGDAAVPAAPAATAAQTLIATRQALAGSAERSGASSENSSLGAQKVWDGAGPNSSGFDPNEGIDQVRVLEALNEDIASGRVGLAELKERGLIKDGSQTVLRGNTGDPAKDQPMPFRELLFPAAHTGIYVPTKLGQLSDYHGIMIAMPGIGGTVSTARTVMDLALTFSKAKKDAVLDDVDGRRFRVVTFPMDATLNGMAAGAPFAFGTPEGSVAAVRHVLLTLKLMYPGKPVFLTGRSQGGLISLEYASRHGDAAGVIAMNPSHPKMVADAIRIHEDPAAAIFNGEPVVFDPKSWNAFKTFTSRFETLNEPSRSPALVILGRNDPSHSQPDYNDSYLDYVGRDAAHRRAAVFDTTPEKSHNLWERREEEMYAAVVKEMARFMALLN